MLFACNRFVNEMFLRGLKDQDYSLNLLSLILLFKQLNPVKQAAEEN